MSCATSIPISSVVSMRNRMDPSAAERRGHSAYLRFARLVDRVFDRLRHRDAFAVTQPSAATGGGLDELRRSKYCLLVTYRADGTPVPTPVWLAVDDRGRMFVKTRADAGKAKRVRRDGRALIAPCTTRGRPTGPARPATATIVSADGRRHAEECLARAYGLGRRLSERILGGPDELAVYIELACD